MNKERYNQIIDEVYDNYKTEWMKENPPFAGPYTDPCLTQDELIKKCKTDSEFSEKWGLKIEERELSDNERQGILERVSPMYYMDQQFGGEDIFTRNNIPTKLITLTYNNETVESYD